MGTKITTAQSFQLSNYSKIIVWLDGDKAGRSASANISKSLALLTEVKVIHTELDPKKLSNAQIHGMIHDRPSTT